jgi:hypothetical protein
LDDLAPGFFLEVSRQLAREREKKTIGFPWSPREREKKARLMAALVARTMLIDLSFSR